MQLFHTRHDTMIYFYVRSEADMPVQSTALVQTNRKKNKNAHVISRIVQKMTVSSKLLHDVFV